MDIILKPLPTLEIELGSALPPIYVDLTPSADAIEIELDPYGHKEYEGDYTVTPTSGTQTLFTENLMMKDNITINPIPSNYGLITWDGSTLTVS